MPCVVTGVIWLYSGPAEFSVKQLKEVMTQRGIPLQPVLTMKVKRKYSRRKDIVHLLTYQSSKGWSSRACRGNQCPLFILVQTDESEVIPVLYVCVHTGNPRITGNLLPENSISCHLEDFV